MALLDINFSETVFVFDLDDTLYQESDYQASGFREILRQIERIYGKNLKRELDSLIQHGSPDVLHGLCAAAGLPESVKQTLLWIYRLHMPNISLSEDARAAISFIRENSAGFAILTDGRSFSQRAKLSALGLADVPVYISEEYGDQKPSHLRLEAVMRDMPNKQYVYVADNPKKDFVAPNRLGWKTIGVIGTDKNIHTQHHENISSEYLPSVWVDCLSDLTNLGYENENI
jgi:putative hydrolase of the HAD superfamily